MLGYLKKQHSAEIQWNVNFRHLLVLFIIYLNKICKVISAADINISSVKNLCVTITQPGLIKICTSVHFLCDTSLSTLLQILHVNVKKHHFSNLPAF